MNLTREAGTLAVLCVALSALSAPALADLGTVENPPSVSKHVAELFAKADELAAERKQRSEEYLLSLPDKELAELYAKATAPQQLPPSGLSGLSEHALKNIKEDRRKIVQQFLKHGSPLGEREDRVFGERREKLMDELATLGPAAVPALAARMGEEYRMMGHWATARQVLLKMGPDAVEPLIACVNHADSYLRANATSVLAELSDPRAVDALLQAVSDGSGQVRRGAVQGLVRLGPDVVGRDKLVKLLIVGLQDGNCLYESIQGLERYGDESAIEHLRVIERFHIVRGKGDLRYCARQAINSILRRSGKPAEEVPREHYSDQRPSYDELVHIAALCPNAAIRSGAIASLERWRDDRTASFFIERLRQEQNRSLLLHLARSLGIITLPSGDASKSLVSAPVVQEAFDALVLMAETDSHQTLEQEGTMVGAARTVLHAARQRQIHLDSIDRYKKVIHQGISSDIEHLRIDSYSGCTAIAMLPPETGESWTPSEKERMQQQLSPLLYSPNPNIRLIECLGFIGDRRLTPRLVELLGHKDEVIRRFAAHALGRIGDSQALPALEHLAENDPHQYENGVYGVREAAREAIERIRVLEPPGPTNSAEDRKGD